MFLDQSHVDPERNLIHPDEKHVDPEWNLMLLDRKHVDPGRNLIRLDEKHVDQEWNLMLLDRKHVDPDRNLILLDEKHVDPARNFRFLDVLVTPGKNPRHLEERPVVAAPDTEVGVDQNWPTMRSSPGWRVRRTSSFFISGPVYAGAASRRPPAPPATTPEALGKWRRSHPAGSGQRRDRVNSGATSCPTPRSAATRLG